MSDPTTPASTENSENSENSGSSEGVSTLRAVLAEEKAPETDIAREMAIHALWIAPVVMLVAGLWRGWGGVLGAGIALALVSVNFLLAASLMRWAGRISPEMLAGTALGGYVLRLGLITVVGLALKQVAGVDFITFGIVLIVTHLGLLVWELRSVSLSLAAPGLHPAGE